MNRSKASHRPDDNENQYETMDERLELQRRFVFGVMVVLAFLALAGFILFAPLVFSMIESYVWGTNHVYSTFDAMNLADPLGKIYEPVLDRLPSLP